MTDEEDPKEDPKTARKTVTLIEAVFLLESDMIGGKETTEVELEQAEWLAESLLRRYGLTPEDVEGLKTPEQIREKVCSGEL